MDFKKMLYDTADQHNYARYQGAIQALKNASQHIQSLVNDNKTPNEIAVSITKHIVDKITNKAIKQVEIERANKRRNYFLEMLRYCELVVKQVKKYLN